MSKQPTTLAVAGAIIGVVVVGGVPATWAAPASSSMTAFRQATLSDVTDVSYRRGCYYGRRVYLGAPIGTAAAATAIGACYYGPGGYYGPGYCSAYYGPEYYGPGYCYLGYYASSAH